MVINPIVGVYIPILRIPIKGGMSIPNHKWDDPPSKTPPQVGDFRGRLGHWLVDMVDMVG